MSSNSSYPVLLAPISGRQIVEPCFNKRGRHYKKGPSELVVFSKISPLKEIDCRWSVTIDGHRYEPDWVFVDKERGIYVDIEVDEPYSASGKPTHYINEDGSERDDVRNRAFQKAGWYVARFSERQLYTAPETCLKSIYEMLANAGAIDMIPERYQSIPDLQSESRWSEKDSLKMKRTHYRDTYLKYNPARLGLRGYLECTKLIIPILLKSIFNYKLRREMSVQLMWFFFPKKH